MDGSFTQTISSQNSTLNATDSDAGFFAGIWNSITSLFNSNLKLFVFYIIMIVIPLLIILAIFIVKKGGVYYYKNENGEQEGEERVEVKKHVLYDKVPDDKKDTFYVQGRRSNDNLSRAHTLKPATSSEIKNIIKSKKVSVVSIDKNNPVKAVEQIFRDVAEEDLKKGYYYKGKGQYKLAVQFFDEYVLFTSDDEKRKLIELEIISCMLIAKKYDSAEYRILRLASSGYSFTEQQMNRLNKILEIIGSPRRLK
ncbi:MAG: hypothetical protein R2876_06630 [Eubacteriales bacterium]